MWGTHTKFLGMQGWMQGAGAHMRGIAEVVYHLDSNDPRRINGVERHHISPGGTYGPHPLTGEIQADGLLRITIDGSTAYLKRCAEHEWPGAGPGGGGCCTIS